MTFSIHFSLMSSPDVKKALHVEKFKVANPGLLQDMSRFFILGLCDFSLFSIVTNQINPIRLALVEIELEKC